MPQRAQLETPEFRKLSPNAQAYLLALVTLFERMEDGAGDREVAKARSEVDQNLAKLSEEEGTEVSDFAHRCDYPEMYE